MLCYVMLCMYVCIFPKVVFSICRVFVGALAWPSRSRPPELLEEVDQEFILLWVLFLCRFWLISRGTVMIRL